MKRILFLTLFVFAACGEQQPESEQTTLREVDRSPAPATNWVVIDGIEFPAAMAEAPDAVIEAYVFAAKNQDVLEYMPCYCGCENPRFAHQNNYDCFIDSIDRSGEVPRVDPDPMGFG